MKQIFGRGPSLQFRLLLAIVSAVLLMVADSKYDSFAAFRVYLNSLVTPLQYLANAPHMVLDSMSERVETREHLQTRNDLLERQLFLQRSTVLRMEHLERENQRLRALLGSPVQQDSRRMVAEIMSVDSDPFTLQVVIDKGSLDGVYEGQPVLNEQGVVGQIKHVASTTSRVLLITDASHGIPLRVERNDIRTLAHGSGHLDQLVLPFIPHSTDMKVGDRLVTSGLGLRFPEGYPVATITQFNYQEGQPYAEVVAEPVVALDRLRYLLLLWPHNQAQNGTGQGEVNDD